MLKNYTQLEFENMSKNKTGKNKNRYRAEFYNQQDEWKKVLPQLRAIGPVKLETMLSGVNEIVKETPEEKLEKDFAYRSMRAKLQDKGDLYEALVKKYNKLEKNFDTFSAIKTGSNLNTTKPNVFEVSSNSKNGKDNLIPIVLASDWHIDEVVTLGTVNGKNEYNFEIACKRVENFTQNLLIEVEKYRHFSNIDTIIVGLLGDVIGGGIHAELQQTNSMSAIDATIAAKDLFIKFFNTLISKGKFKKIVVLTNHGNHSRLSPKCQFNNEQGMSLEHLIYDSLTSHYKDEKIMEIHTSEAGLGYYTIKNNDKTFVIRNFHGQQVRGQGGIAGITIPLMKYIMKQDVSDKADFTILGHFHSLTYSKSFCINGSLVGFNAFALQNGFSYEPPQQAFMIYDVNKNMITNKSFILCE
jgi:hypothetical protein